MAKVKINEKSLICLKRVCQNSQTNVQSDKVSKYQTDNFPPDIIKFRLKTATGSDAVSTALLANLHELYIQTGSLIHLNAQMCYNPADNMSNITFFNLIKTLFN